MELDRLVCPAGQHASRNTACQPGSSNARTPASLGRRRAAAEVTPALHDSGALLNCLSLAGQRVGSR